MNYGIIKANKLDAANEAYTPFYAVEPIIKHIPPHVTTIWCPFDEEWSAYVRLLTEKGYNVIFSHLVYGQDFFAHEPKEPYDVIISNPPYNIKDKVLARLNKLGKPYAMLLPLATLQGQKRFDDLIGLQALIFDKRIGFHNPMSFDKTIESNYSASIYVCKDFLERDLIFEKITKFERALQEK